MLRLRCSGVREVKRRECIPVQRRSRVSGQGIEPHLNLRQDFRRVQCSKGGGEGLQVRGSLIELPPGRRQVAALDVQEADGDLDEGVVEKPERVRGFAPEVLKGLVGLPAAACAQELEAGEQGDRKLAVVDVGRAVALEAFEPEGVLLRARERHDATS